jgi:sodium transport system permease protein
MAPSLTIARKELLDHSRDVRSLVTTAGLLLLGPGIVTLVSKSTLAGHERGPAILLAMAAVFALLAAVTGSTNVATDVTAGERERRSLVPLRLCPVSPFQLAAGKWLAASAFGLGGLVLTMAALTYVLGAAAAVVVSLRMLVALAPLALLSSAVQLLLAARSRTTKEAQTSLSHLAFVPMVVGMVGVFFPGALNGWPSLLPLVGQQQLMTQAMAGEPWSLAGILIPTAVTLGAAVPVLVLTGRALGRDDVLEG